MHPSKSPISPDSYSFLQRYLRDESGIVLDLGKNYLLEARLLPILQKRKITGLDELCQILRANKQPAISREVVEAMTTNETFFFRDIHPFDALKNVILPELINARSMTRTLSIWSAAASTGQEIYSIAMLLREAGLHDWKLNLLATDLSQEVLTRAQEGRYLDIEVNRGLPASYLIKYFDRAGLRWQIKPEVRAMVRFQQGDLRKSSARGGPFDVVFCRNVLIYFDPATKEGVLNDIARSVTKGGYLGLGAAETLLNLPCPFDRVIIGQAVLYRRR